MRALPAQQKYICKDDRDLPVEEQTIFTLRRIPLPKLAKIEDELYKATGIGKRREEKIRTGNNQMKILQEGLAGWENFKDEDGEDIPFSNDVNLFSSIPADARRELADAILGQAGADED